MSSWRKPIVVKRANGGEYVEAEWRPGMRSEVPNVVATVSPASGRDLQRLPEGMRTKTTYKIITDSEIRTADENASPPIEPDWIVLDDGEYVVVHSAHWNNGVIPHYEALCQRRTPDQEHVADA